MGAPILRPLYRGRPAAIHKNYNILGCLGVGAANEGPRRDALAVDRVVKATRPQASGGELAAWRAGWDTGFHGKFESWNVDVSVQLAPWLKTLATRCPSASTRPLRTWPAPA